jgi:hypothetical protein
VNCLLCDKPLVADGNSWIEGAYDFHRECSLRNVLGGIGHLLDHAHFCVVLGDPDAGLDYRTSALLVDAYIAAVGVEMALTWTDVVK